MLCFLMFFERQIIYVKIDLDGKIDFKNIKYVVEMNMIFSRHEIVKIFEFSFSYRITRFKSINEFIKISSQHRFWWKAISLFAKIFFDNIKRDSNTIMTIRKSWLDNFVVAIFKLPYLCDKWAEWRF